MQPEIVILLLTKGRNPYTIRTIRGIEENLEYDNYSYYIADAGSTWKEHSEVCRLLDDYGAKYKHHSRPMAAGKNWNTGIYQAYRYSNVYLRLENDFELEKKFNPTPYLRVLEEVPEVGCIRLGLLPIMLDIHTVAHDGRIYQNIQKSTHYIWSGNPCLVHRRFHDVYGMFRGKYPPGECEVRFDYHIRITEGPEIWRPNALGDWGPFGHFGEDKSEF